MEGLVFLQENVLLSPCNNNEIKHFQINPITNTRLQVGIGSFGFIVLQLLKTKQCTFYYLKENYYF